MNVRGMTLPELLIALASSSFLMMVLMQQYVGVKQHYQQSVHRLENALDLQWVLDVIRDSVRQAGFTPCGRIDHLLGVDTRNPSADLTSFSINPGSESGFQSNHMYRHYGLLIEKKSPTLLTVTDDLVVSHGRPVLIADCYHAEVHTVQQLKAMSGHWEMTLEQPLVYHYRSPVFIGEWLEERVDWRSGALFYRLGHAEVLSNDVDGLSLVLAHAHGKRLLQLTLTLEKNREMQLDAVIRQD